MAKKERVPIAVKPKTHRTIEDKFRFLMKHGDTFSLENVKGCITHTYNLYHQKPAGVSWKSFLTSRVMKINCPE